MKMGRLLSIHRKIVLGILSRLNKSGGNPRRLSFYNDFQSEIWRSYTEKENRQMKKQVPIVSMLIVMFFVFIFTSSAMANSARKVTGAARWSWPSTNVWSTVNIIETAPGQAHGSFHVWEDDAEEGRRGWKANPVCIDLASNVSGEINASLVLQISSINSVSFPGQVGQYVKLWYRDSGSPAAAGDLAGVVVWPPVDNKPDCAYEPAAGSWPITGGNISIHD
jgi:hypothetical protein